ncbi:MAG: efflux RND transporter periplasmic adaptor subunit, partial [Vicinamibacterales bacterium]
HRSALARAAAANAARDAASAAAAGADVAASYTVISAPFSGIVTARTVDPGSMAMPGAPLITLEDPSTFRLEVQVDDQRATLVKPGQDVEVRVDDGQMQSGAWLHGRVVEIARIDSVSHSFAVKVELPTGAASRSGLYGRVRFAGPARDTLTVPATAVVRRGQLTFVFKVGADGAAHLRPVTIGQAAHERVEVLAGVQAGDSVVSDPPAALSDGARVARSAS